MKMSGWLWSLAKRIARREIDKRFNYSFDELDLGNLKGPLFIVTNHVCAWDPFMVAMAFSDRQLAFVASEHILRLPRIGKFVERHTDVIPHKKAGGGTRSTIECLKRLKNGESIFIASEGEQSWDGVSGSVVSSTGKLLKKSGASIVTLRFEGGYLAKPRWADNARRGEVRLKYVNTYAAEEVAKMTPEEIKECINRDLYFDIWEWQREAAHTVSGMHKYIPQKGGLADGIERLLYMCPACKKVGRLTSNDAMISCECGYKIELMDTGFFSLVEPFETIAEWNEWQDNELEKLLVDGEPFSQVRGKAGADSCEDGEEDKQVEVFGDSGVALFEIKNGHEECEAASGRISIVRDTEDACGRAGGELYLQIGDSGMRFALSEIGSMTMILYNRIVFSWNDVYYEIRPDNMKGRTNLRKYIVAWKLRGGWEE